MRTIVQKWGNSLGVRIPAMYARELEISYGSAVDITEEGGRLVIFSPRKTLDDMLSGITPENLHEAIDTGPSLGNEAW